MTSNRQDCISSSCITPPTTLLTLPAELYVLITDFLDECDKTCLSLCSHALRTRTGLTYSSTQHTNRSKDPQRFQILYRLARDIPGSFCCYNCSTIHLSTPQIRMPGSMFHQSYYTNWLFRQPFVDAVGCRPDDSSTFAYYLGHLPFFETHNVYSDYLFTFQHLQLAMARYRDESANGIELDALSWTEVRRSEAHAYSTLLSIEAAVAHDQLCLRVQHWIAFDHRYAKSFHSFYGTFQERILPRVCLHHWIDDVPRIWQRFQCIVNHFLNSGEPKCGQCRDNIFCHRCGVEFAMDITDLDHQGSVFILTKWLNLGYGQTPLDPKWQRHLARGTNQYLPEFPNWREQVPLSEIFNNGKVWETLDQENAAALRQQLFRFTFKPRKAYCALRKEPGNKKSWIRPTSSDGSSNHNALLAMLATLAVGVVCVML